MSFVTGVIWKGFANTKSSEVLKKQFEKYCDWCWDMAMATVTFAEEDIINYIFH